MTNKLVVVVNSLKLPKIKKILLYEMKFLIPNYSCLQNSWLGRYRPQIPVLSLLCPQLNLLTPPEQNPGYNTAYSCGTFSEKYFHMRICYTDRATRNFGWFWLNLNSSKTSHFLSYPKCVCVCVCVCVCDMCFAQESRSLAKAGLTRVL